MTLIIKEVRSAIFTSKQDKASRVDEISNRFLRIIVNELLSQLIYLFQAYVDRGYHLRKFKIINTIVLRKLGKDNYFELKSYRSIALLSTLRKILKKIIAKRLSDCVEKNALLFLEQISARRDRSIEIALKILINVIYTM